MSRLAYCDESYVRSYRDKSTRWLMMCWEARAVFRMLETELDRAGMIGREGEETVDIIALHTKLPVEVVARGLPDLERRGYLVVTDNYILDPDFVEAESAITSDKTRQAESRAKRRGLAMSRNVTGSHAPQEAPNRPISPPSALPSEEADSAPSEQRSPDEPSEEESRDVTAHHAASPPVTQRDEASRDHGAGEQNVTQYSTVPSSTVPCRAEITRADADGGWGGLPPPPEFLEALKLPIRERSMRAERDPHMTAYTFPERWPEVVTVATTLARSLGQRPPVLSGYTHDSGVKRIVHLFASGRTLAELQRACVAAPQHDYMRGKDVSALTPSVVRRLLEPVPEARPKGRGGPLQPTPPNLSEDDFLARQGVLPGATR